LFHIGYYRDRSHGRKIPTGKPLANLTEEVFKNCAEQAVMQVRYGRVDLANHITNYAERAIKLLIPFVRAAEKQRARELAIAAERHRRQKSLLSVRRKALSGPWAGGSTNIRSISYGFDVFNSYVLDHLRVSAYEFAQSTLRTAADDAMKAYARLRVTLADSLASGETQQKINQAIFKIFTDTNRAAVIGQTETMRTMNSAGMMLAMATGVTNASRWLASSDACPACRELNGQVREHGRAFAFNPKAKSKLYQTIEHPPLHPHCFCVVTDVIDDRANIDSGVVDRLRILAYDPSAVPSRFGRGERLAASLRAKR